MVGIMDYMLHELLAGLNIKTFDSRASVYIYSDEYFNLVARASDSPGLREKGRKRYPKDQGVIGEVWNKGSACYTRMSADRDRWNRQCVDEFGMDPKETRSIKMHSLSMIGYRIEAPGAHPEPVGIVMIESLSRQGVNGTHVDTIATLDSWPIIRTVLQQIIQSLDEDDAFPLD